MKTEQEILESFEYNRERVRQIIHERDRYQHSSEQYRALELQLDFARQIVATLAWVLDF